MNNTKNKAINTLNNISNQDFNKFSQSQIDSTYNQLKKLSDGLPKVPTGNMKKVQAGMQGGTTSSAGANDGVGATTTPITPKITQPTTPKLKVGSFENSQTSGQQEINKIQDDLYDGGEGVDNRLNDIKGKNIDSAKDVLNNILEGYNTQRTELFGVQAQEREDQRARQFGLGTIGSSFGTRDRTDLNKQQLTQRDDFENTVDNSIRTFNQEIEDFSLKEFQIKEQALQQSTDAYIAHVTGEDQRKQEFVQGQVLPVLKELNYENLPDNEKAFVAKQLNLDPSVIDSAIAKDKEDTNNQLLEYYQKMRVSGRDITGVDKSIFDKLNNGEELTQNDIISSSVSVGASQGSQGNQDDSYDAFGLLTIGEKKLVDEALDRKQQIKLGSLEELAYSVVPSGLKNGDNERKDLINRIQSKLQVKIADILSDPNLTREEKTAEVARYFSDDFSNDAEREGHKMYDVSDKEDDAVLKSFYNLPYLKQSILVADNPDLFLDNITISHITTISNNVGAAVRSGRGLNEEEFKAYNQTLDIIRNKAITAELTTNSSIDKNDFEEYTDKVTKLDYALKQIESIPQEYWGQFNALNNTIRNNVTNKFFNDAKPAPAIDEKSGKPMKNSNGEPLYKINENDYRQFMLSEIGQAKESGIPANVIEKYYSVFASFLELRRDLFGTAQTATELSNAFFPSSTDTLGTIYQKTLAHRASEESRTVLLDLLKNVQGSIDDFKDHNTALMEESIVNQINQI